MIDKVVIIASLDYFDRTSALLLCVCIEVLIFNEVHSSDDFGKILILLSNCPKKEFTSTPQMI
jgi:hypothetical protein